MFQKLNAIWSKIGLVQKALLGAIVIACVITGVLLTKWATKPEMRLLYGNLELEECSKIADKISEKDIPYEIRGGGTSVYVPAEQVHALRASLAGDGIVPTSGEPGYEIFDSQGVGVSPMVQKMNYNRAIQGELARTIQVYEGIENARVHIVRPEQTMFTTDGESAKAAVMVKLKPGYRLSPTTVAAITNLVAGAIEGLSPENVTVTDSNGRMLSGQNANDPLITGATSYKDYKMAVEQEMSQRLLQSLETVLGPGRATVIAQATIDMTKETIVQTVYEKGIPAEEIIEESKTVQNAVFDEDGKETTPSSQESSGTTTVTNKIPETTTTKATVPGKIVEWSVSVVVDLSKEVLPAENTEGAEQANTASAAQTELIMSVDDVKEIVRTAIGPSLIKDENLTVKHVAFNRPQAALMIQEPTTMEKLAPIIEIARQSSMGILAVCALLVLKIFTSAGKKAAADQDAVMAVSQGLPMSAGQMLPMPTGGDPMLAMREHISLQLRQNPEQVKQLFAAWLSEGK